MSSLAQVKIQVQAHETPRRRWLKAVAALSGCSALSATSATQWARPDPAAADLAADLADRLDEAVQSGAVTNLHAVCVVRGGALVFERYYAGQDERWGASLGRIPFDAETKHDLRSVTKSIVGLLYGMALAENKVPALNIPVLDAFAAYSNLNGDARRSAIRMSDVLTMTMGLDWNEDLPYGDSRNSEIAMERSADRYRYVLDRPVVAVPGSTWRYSGGATALLGRLIAHGVNMPLEDYARLRLFEPLGIKDVEWVPGLNGEAAAASGLRMRASDLARVGQLLLQQGRWDGASVVSADWVAASLTPRVPAFEGVSYGYHWYVAQRRDGSRATMAMGWGGQRLVVIPSLALVYVIFMGNYSRPAQEQLKAVFSVQTLIHQSLR